MTSFKELGLIKQQLGLDRPWQSYHNQQAQVLTVTVIPCGHEDPSFNKPDDLPYEMNITKLPNQQNNLKDVLQNNQDIWIEIFKNHIGNVQKFTKTNTSPSFSIYRTPFDAMQASPWNDREES